MDNMIKYLHRWLIEKVVGNRPVIMNVKFIDGINLAANQDILIYGNTFHIDKVEMPLVPSAEGELVLETAREVAHRRFAMRKKASVG